jgi:RNA polymerase sigma-70 factor (ECF subfamily)
MADAFDSLKAGDASPHLAEGQGLRLRELMREYQAGRFEAFDEIYAAVAPGLRRYLLSQARDGAKADDLVQETFLQIHRARHTYDPSYPLMPWAIAIARHVWLMDRRTLSRRPWAPDDVMTVELPVRAEASSLADRSDVRRALAQVAPARRNAVIQHHLLGFSFKEIAARSGIAETAAKLRSSRGMAQLRALLKTNTGSAGNTERKKR